jgi:hypothetical protein
VQILRNSLPFYGTQRFITAFTRALLSQTNSVNNPPTNLISPRSVIILSTHLHLSHSMVYLILTFPPITYFHSSSPHLCHMPCQSHPQLDQYKYTGRRVQVMVLIIMQLSPASCHFIPLWSKYSQHPDLKHPQSMFLP